GCPRARSGCPIPSPASRRRSHLLDGEACNVRADPEHWRILGASVAGTSHRSRGLGCDDANAYRLLADGTAILAVADGAGSASRAAEGAACAVRSALLRVESGLQESTPCDEAGWCELLQALLQD